VDDYRHIVQSCAFVENRFQQLGTNTRVNTYAGFHEFAQGHPAFYYDNRAGARFGHTDNGRYDFLDRSRHVPARPAEKTGLGDSHQRPADFRLKGRDRNDEHEDQKIIVQVTQSFEMKLNSKEIKQQYSRYYNKDYTAEKSFAPRAFEEIDDPVDHQADKKKFDTNSPPRISCHAMEIIDKSLQFLNPFEFQLPGSQ
jgi:hypothetical protein